MVHGISPSELEHGKDVTTVCGVLKKLLRRTIVVTDAPDFDQAWLNTLLAAAGVDQGFVLQDFDLLPANLRPEEYRQFVLLLDRSSAPHRAGPDALRLASALLEVRLGRPPQTIEIEAE